MKLKINFIENDINFDYGYINVFEIENKNYFYRIVKSLNDLSAGFIDDDVAFFNEQNDEKNLNVKLISDYFNIDFDSRKMNNLINKLICLNMTDQDRTKLVTVYKKIISIFNGAINSIDLPITKNSEFGLESFVKVLNFSIATKESILENLLLMIDIVRELKIYDLLIFINLKQYLQKNELIELYKYAVYNNVYIMLIDSQSYGTLLEYEKKLIIDSNLDEFMI